MPVVNSRTENQLVGAVLRAEVLGMLSEAIATKGQSTNTPSERPLNQDQKEGKPAQNGGE